MNQLTQTASFIASEISSVKIRERKRTASAQRHFKHAIECLVKDLWRGRSTVGVGQNYGEGYELDVTKSWMDELTK